MCGLWPIWPSFHGMRPVCLGRLVGDLWPSTTMIDVVNFGCGCVFLDCMGGNSIGKGKDFS